MFDRIRKNKQAKKLEDILRDKVVEADKLYKPEGNKFLVLKSRKKVDHLQLQKMAISGVSNAAKAGIIGVLPAALIYQIGAKVGLGFFEEYFRNTFIENLTPNRGAGDTLSLYLVKEENISLRYKQNILLMRNRIQATIYAVAGFIESQGLSLDAIRRNDIDPAKQRQITNFIDSQHRWRTSYRSMATALRLFAEENAEIVRRIKDTPANRPDDYRRLFQLNAVFAYEVADVIIGFLRSFELQGIPELRRLHHEIMTEVERGRGQVSNLESKIESSRKSGIITQERFNSAVKSIAGRRRALDLIEIRWQTLLKKIDDSKQKPSVFSQIIEKLEIIKSEAEINLTITGLAAVTGAVQENFVALVEMIDDVDKLEVVPITDEDVGIFLNLDIDNKDNPPLSIESS